MDSIVSVEWLVEHFESPELIILDASQAHNKTKLKPQYPELKIKGAIPFSLKTFSDAASQYPNTLPSPNAFETAARKLGINKDSLIIVYDNLGIYTSPRVWWLFNVMGHKNIAILNGGLDAWVSKGMPTENAQLDLNINLGNFKAIYDSDIVRNFEQIKENLDHQNELVIDARSSDRFHSLVPEPRQGLRSGNIPNSINLPYTQLLENGYLVSKAKLLQIFTSLEIPAKQSIVFSCGSGITACILNLAYQQIGNNPTAVYDGSWTEWGQRYPA